MDYVSAIKLGGPVSLVVNLVDDYTGDGCNDGDLTVFLDGVRNKPERKRNGSFVFRDLSEPSCRVIVRGDRFLEESFTVNLDDLDPKSPVVPVSLKPATTYQFRKHSPVIRVTVVDQNGDPLPDVTIQAVLTSDECARARVGSPGAEPGDQQISVVDITGKIASGDEYRFNTRDGEELGTAMILAPGESEGAYRLTAPLANPLPRGCLLMPLLKSRTNRKGEAVFGFRNLYQKTCGVRLRFTLGDQVMEREGVLEEATTWGLGTIRFPD